MMNGNPQWEEGYVKLSNELLDALINTDLSGLEFRCILFLLRKTYGYNKKEDKISLRQWSEGLCVRRQNVWVVLQRLIRRNIVWCYGSKPKSAQTWQLNKHYRTWDGYIPNDSEDRSVMDSNDNSVMVEHDNEDQSVMVEHDNEDQSVMVEHDNSVMILHDSEDRSVMDGNDKSVMIPHEHTKDSKDSNTINSRKTNINNRKEGEPEKAPRKISGKQDKTMQQHWFEALCWLVHRHKDYGLLSKQDRAAIATTAKQIRSSPNEYTLDDLRAWYRDIWSKEWPGKQPNSATIQPPTLKQIKIGIGRTRSDSDESDMDADSVSAVLDFSIKELL